MSYQDYEVRITFLSADSGSVEYIFPYAQQVEDPQPRNKDVIHEGNRGDGSIRIPGGIKSHAITIRGKLWDEDGYEDLTALMAELREKVTTSPGTLTMEHRPLTGGAWTTDWQYTVYRNTEITFPQSFRTGVQDYEVTFFVLSY